MRLPARTGTVAGTDGRGSRVAPLSPGHGFRAAARTGRRLVRRPGGRSAVRPDRTPARIRAGTRRRCRLRALEAGAPAGRVVLAGFSQGACLALEYTLRRRRPAALACLTGCRVGFPEASFDGRLDGLPVYMSCGDADPWIPLDPFMASARLLAAAGARLTLDIIPDRAHTVSAIEIRAFEGLLRTVGEQGPAGRSGRTP